MSIVAADVPLVERGFGDASASDPEKIDHDAGDAHADAQHQQRGHGQYG
jgi:hypothetical protein